MGHHNKKMVLMDYLVRTTYFATGPSYFANAAVFFGRKMSITF